MARNPSKTKHKICAFAGCRKMFALTRKDRRTRKFCSRDCYKNSMRRFDDIPYPMIWHNGKREYYHRVVYMIATGEQLTSKDIIHHKDGNPFNRAPENLEKLDGKHAHLHKHNYHRLQRTVESFETVYVGNVAINF